MAKTLSYMLPLGTLAPAFDLPDFDGKHYSINNFKDAPALLVAFICCHCPYVKHIIEEFARMAAEYIDKGAAVVAINANNIEDYPQDRPEKMKEDAQRLGFKFPYLFDATQQTARAYKAVCTPDFFLFDNVRKLAYRGRMDDSRPENNFPVTGKDLRAAMDALLTGAPVPSDQKPSLGCNIKWIPGNEPDDD